MGSGFRVFCKQVLRSFPEIRVVPIRYKYVGFRHDIYIYIHIIYIYIYIYIYVYIYIYIYIIYIYIHL